MTSHDPDVGAVEGRPPASTRARLDRARVVGAALEFIDEHGLPGLTMRRLGERLGVEAMSLYRYVPGKEDLLDAVVEELFAGMAQDPDVITTPEHGWQDFLQRMAHGVRRIALGNPKAFPLVAARPPEAPWLRPPLRSLEWVENFLSGLVSEGFPPETAVAAYRAFTSFLLGHLLLEVATMGADVGPLDTLEDGSVEPDDLEDHPTVVTMRSALSEDHAAVEFEESLENLLDRLALILAESPGDGS